VIQPVKIGRHIPTADALSPFQGKNAKYLIPPKSWYTSTNLYGVFASQKKVISIDMCHTLKRNNIDFKKAE
jgi:hypothetical protein